VAASRTDRTTEEVIHRRGGLGTDAPIYCM
jgi:hypothetical protein